MIQKTHTCTKCNSSNIVKNGHNKSGSPQYKCKSCGTCRVLKPNNKHAELDKEAVGRAYEERPSYRAIGRIFNVSHVTIFKLLKKK